jgi:hypothetical protein
VVVRVRDEVLLDPGRGRDLRIREAAGTTERVDRRVEDAPLAVRRIGLGTTGGHDHDHAAARIAVAGVGAVGLERAVREVPVLRRHRLLGTDEILVVEPELSARDDFLADEDGDARDVLVRHRLDDREHVVALDDLLGLRARDLPRDDDAGQHHDAHHEDRSEDTPARCRSHHQVWTVAVRSSIRVCHVGW